MAVSTKLGIWGLLTIVVIGAGVLIGIRLLPLSQSEEVIIGINEELRDIPLQSDKPLIQTITSGGEPISVIIATTKQADTKPALLHLTVKDKKGQVLSTGRGSNLELHDKHYAVSIPIKWITPTKGQRLSLELSSTQETTSLRATTDTGYTNGSLTAPSSTDAADLVLSLVHPEPLSPNQQQGIVLGVAFAIALAVIEFIFASHPNTKRHWQAAACLLILGSIAISLPLLFSDQPWGIGDWDYRFSIHTIYNQIIFHFHQFPLWNPYICGGAAALGDPEFALFTPSFISTAFFGVENGLKIALPLALSIMAVGCLTLSKRLGYSVLAAVIGTVIMVFNGAMILKIVEGHVTLIFAVMWVPWLLWAWLKAYQTQKKSLLLPNISVLLAALFLTLMLLSGGIYILSYTLPLLFVLPLFTKQPRRAYHISIASTLWFFTFSAAQLIPTLFWLKEFPDPAYVNSTATFPYLLDIFFRQHPYGTSILPGQLAGWHEYGAYIGYGSLVLGLIGLFTQKQPRLKLAFLTLIIISLILSTSGPSLAPLLNRIPFIPRSNISRFVLLTALMVGLVAARGITTLQKKNMPSVIILIILGAITIDLWSFAYPQLTKTFTIPTPINRPTPAPYPIAHTNKAITTRVGGLDYSRSLTFTQAGYGTFNFCTVIGPSIHVVKQEENPNTPYAQIQNKKGEAVPISNWTPSSFDLQYQSDSPETILINSNYASGWHASFGQAVSDTGQLAVKVPAGNQTISLSYKTPGMWLGIAITILSILTAAWCIKKQH